MAATLSYPGIYIQELPSGDHAVAGVSTSSTAFIDAFARGPVGQAVQVTSPSDFARRFGGVTPLSEASYAVQQFFVNGGSVAWIVRVATTTAANAGSPALTPTAATVVLHGGGKDVMKASALSVGGWGNQLQITATQTTPPGQPADATRFNLLVQETQTTGSNTTVVATETYLNLVMDPTSAFYAPAVVNPVSQMVQLADLAVAPAVSPPPDQSVGPVKLASGADGGPPDAAGLKGALSALDRIAPQIFNIMCIPAAANLGKADYADVVNTAVAYCEAKRAFMIVDIPASLTDPAKMLTWGNDNSIRPSPNAAVYFPRLLVPTNGQMRNSPASGTMAGIYAKTDQAIGVWKAPAGVNASLANASLATVLTDAENGSLNPYGINALRTFPIFGTISWGARTTVGSDQLSSDWKYIPVRRLTLFIEESLYQGLRWAVFEPNDDTLWTQIRGAVDGFMADRYREGAFAGSTPQSAYVVKCDAETTTATDVNLGVVNVFVAFAPVKPAEFVVLQIQQLAGQTQT